MIEETVAALLEKKLILYQTETVWGIGGDATDPKVVEKIYQLKRRADHKALIVLVNTRAMLLDYVQSIPKEAEDFILSERPTTVIYPKGIGFASNLLGTDSSIGIRITSHPFCKELIDRFGKPIISTSANISGAITPTSFDSIDQQILDGVDYIVPLTKEGAKADVIPSRVVKINSEGQIQIIRQ